MASNAVDEAIGITLTLGTSTWETGTELLDFDWSGARRNALETTKQTTAKASAGTFGNRTFLFSSLSDAGQVTITFHFNPDKLPPIDAVAETLTITFLGPDDVGGATWVCSGGCIEYSFSATLGEKMVGTIVWKCSGPVTVTADA